MTVDQLNPADWEMDYDEDNHFSFVEDENCNITGLGWRGKAEFAAEINRYDEVANGEPMSEDDQWTADDITHHWAVLDADGERLLPSHEGHPAALKVTALWGAR